MKMGAREYLFLWSECVLHVWPWPERLHEARYFPNTDRVEITQPNGKWSFKVNREGSASCDILKKHGLTQDQIDEAVKKYLEEDQCIEVKYPARWLPPGTLEEK